VDAQLNLKRAAKALGSKRAEMATPADAERVTGYVLGGVSPLGGRKRLPTVIDASAREETSMFVSAGRRGLEIEIAPGDLARLAGASFADLCRA
ncbi:MAG: Cys-tRNA(Pro) deacylase, partial [Pseudomonadales bacterium]|nr:Cys-tRNA(Pro) deacylase [Pseudomonadales bacterium]